MVLSSEKFAGVISTTEIQKLYTYSPAHCRKAKILKMFLQGLRYVFFFIPRLRIISPENRAFHKFVLCTGILKA